MTSDRPRKVDRDHRPEPSQAGNEVDPHARTASHRGHQQLVAGCHAFPAAATDPDRQQIMLIDGPAVLGWAEWGAIDARHSLRALTDGLGDLVGLGLIRPHPVEPLALALSGAMNETALWVAGARHREMALRDATAVVDTLLAALPRA